MRLTNLVYFYRRRLRARLVQELFALLGIAVGVALLFAVQVSNTSLSASIVQLTERLSGDAQLQVAAKGPQGFPTALLERVERIEGVRAAAPLLETAVNAVGPRGEQAVTLYAADPSFARLGGDLLSSYTAGRLARLRAIVVPEPIAARIGARFGRSVRLELKGRATAVPVAAVVGRDEVGPVAESPTIVASLAYAQELTDMAGRISRIFVVAAAGREAAVREALERAVGEAARVRAAQFDGRVFEQAALPNDQSTTLFAWIGALVGFLFAFNAMLVMARERRGLIAELRMDGFGAGTVVQVLVFDALMLGLVASLAGIGLGDLLSRHVFHPMPGYLALAFPVGTARTVEWGTVALAVGAGVAAVLLATVGPLARMLSARPIDATEDASLDPRSRGVALGIRWMLAAGVALVGVTTAITLLAPRAALAAIAALIAAMLLILPAVLRTTLALADRARRWVRSVVPAIAIGELLSSGSRSIALAALAATAVFASTAIEGAHADLLRGLDSNARALSGVAQVWVTASGSSNTLATTPFDPGRRLARLERVGEVDVYRGGFLDVGMRRVWVMGFPRRSAPVPRGQVVVGDAARVNARLRAGGWAVVSEAVAAQEGLRVGESFALDTPRAQRFRLAAITTNLGWSPGAVVMNAEDYGRAWGSSAASALHVAIPGVAPAVVKRRVEAALGRQSGLVVETAAEREARLRGTSRDGLSRLTQIASLVLIGAALAMAAGMGAMVWQRRRRLADLKLAGIDHGQLWRALLLETALLLAIGCATGATFGIYGQQLLDTALSSVTGFPIERSLAVGVSLASLTLVAAVASLVVLLPGYVAARVPADAAFQD